MTDAANIYRCSPRMLHTFIIECFEAKKVPFVRGSPGMGKSTIFRNIAKELSLKLIDHRLSTSDPTDMSGLPHFINGYAKFAPFEELFPIASTKLPTNYDGWLVFLDEYNAATKMVQAASYKLILDNMVGQYPLHERVVLAMAGNLDTDRAITNMISTALQSRVIHLEMEVSFREWLEDIALAQNYDPRIIAYLSQYESKLMDFRPDHNEKTFCCPRTWEFMNDLIKGKEIPETHVPLYAGTITSGVAVDFVQFCKVYKQLINVKEILADPKGCRVPHEKDLQWATISHMMEKVNDENFDDLSIYGGRFSLDFQVLFFRSIMVKHSHLRQHPAFAKASSKLIRYLN